MEAEELDNRLSNLEMTTDPQCNGKGKSLETQATDDDVQITCFTEDLQDTVLHFQIIRLPKQLASTIAGHPINNTACACFHLTVSKPIYVWIGCNSVKFGHLYAGASTRPNSMVGVTALLGGTSDNTGSSIARRLVLKTGLSVILACNIPKDSPMLEAAAERKLLEKLRNMGYVKHGDGGLSKPAAGSS